VWQEIGDITVIIVEIEIAAALACSDIIYSAAECVKLPPMRSSKNVLNNQSDAGVLKSANSEVKNLRP
jgi:hypothetical protein